jgi:translation initiation factor 2B subunit (eIF-2B alpha/beta/delta family)
MPTSYFGTRGPVANEAAHNQGKHFDLIVLEGRPDGSGVKAAQFYADSTNIPVTVVLDAAMMYCMERVDLVLTGAEGVVENGGVVNKLGTAALAACAAAQGKPFYVAAESYKFARLYPFSQKDLPDYQARAVSCDFYDTTNQDCHEPGYQGGKPTGRFHAGQIHHPPIYRPGSLDTECRVGRTHSTLSIR